MSADRSSQCTPRYRATGVLITSARRVEGNTVNLVCPRFRVERVLYFLVTAAMQLISTREFPGRAATATVVRAGPPLGK